MAAEQHDGAEAALVELLDGLLREALDQLGREGQGARQVEAAGGQVVGRQHHAARDARGAQRQLVRGDAVDTEGEVRAVVLQGADGHVGQRRLVDEALQRAAGEPLVAAVGEVRRELEELQADAVGVAEVGDLGALVGTAVELDRAVGVDRPRAAGHRARPRRVGVLDLEADVHVARVLRVVDVGHAVVVPVVEQLQDHAAGEVDEGGVDLDARHAEHLAQVGPLEHRLEAPCAPEERLPERQGAIQVGHRRTDVVQAVRPQRREHAVLHEALLGLRAATLFGSVGNHSRRGGYRSARRHAHAAGRLRRAGGSGHRRRSRHRPAHRRDPARAGREGRRRRPRAAGARGHPRGAARRHRRGVGRGGVHRDRGLAGPRRRARDQRRDLHHRAAGRDHPGELAAHDARQPRRRLPLRPPRAAGHEGARLRARRDHRLLGRRHRRDAQRRGLRGLEGRPDGVHEGHRATSTCARASPPTRWRRR